MISNLKDKTLFSGFGLAGIVVLFSVAIFFRVVVVSEVPGITFFEILWWQLLSWIPWGVVIGIGLFKRAEKIRSFIFDWTLSGHLIAAVVTASVTTLWFKFISENWSPFLELDKTRYGVFPWFFIFWFFFGLFLYWGSIHFFQLTGKRETLAAEKAKDPRLVVKKGKISEVINPANVFWIEAQDYYSVLHLKDQQSWVKMTMKELENVFDPSKFVRIHRSTIVNINFLKQVKTENPGRYSAIMADGKIRPISRAGWRDLKKVLKTAK